MWSTKGYPNRCHFPRFAANRLFLGTVIVLFLGFSAIGTDRAYGQTISWTNPLTYQDTSAIPPELRSTITTKLYFSLDGVAWTQFASISGGGETWTGALPVADGVIGYYSATSTIPSSGIESTFSNIVGSPTAAAPPASAPPASAPKDRFDEVTVTLGKYQDTFVDVGHPAIHSGESLIGTYLWPARSVANRGFLRWDLASLPADARITNATLRLYYASEDKGGGDNTLAISVAKVIGTNLDPGKATWRSPDGVVGWAGGADGGAKNLAASESTVVVGNTHGWVVWNVTSMVRDWVKAPWTNSGIALDPDTAGTVDTNRFFASSEYPDPLLRPELTITYLLPSRNPAPQAVPVPSPPLLPNAAADVPSDTFTVSVGGFEDTYVNQGRHSDDNYASDPLIATYTWPANTVSNRGFMRWDLSGLPDNVTVTNAALWLFHVESGGGDPAYTVSVAKVSGAFPDLSRATWNRFDGVSPWPGGGNGGAAAMDPPASSAAIGMSPRWVSWDVTEMVQDWVDRPKTNFGMAIDGDRSAGADSHRYFASGEYPEPTLRPRLLVTFVKNP